jgi:hypothetical protein
MYIGDVEPAGGLCGFIARVLTDVPTVYDEFKDLPAWTVVNQAVIGLIEN